MFAASALSLEPEVVPPSFAGGAATSERSPEKHESHPTEEP